MSDEVKGLIVYTVDVMNKSTTQAESFCEKLLERLKQNRPEGWRSVVLPVRHCGSKVQVFGMTDAGLEEVEALVVEHRELIRTETEQDDQSVRDHVHLMLGAPVRKITNPVKELVEMMMEVSERHGVKNRKDFVTWIMTELVRFEESEVVLRDCVTPADEETRGQYSTGVTKPLK